MVQDFRIGARKFKLIENHPIFLLKEPTAQDFENLECGFCEEPLALKKKWSKCDFCGYRHCKSCQFKQRTFLKAQMNVEGQLARGKVCTLCDRRIMFKLSFAKAKNSVFSKQKQVDVLQIELDRFQREVADL